MEEVEGFGIIRMVGRSLEVEDADKIVVNFLRYITSKGKNRCIVGPV